MTKQLSGKIHVGKCKIKRKSGITYVYERKTQYKPQLKKTVTVSTKLLGKIMPDSMEIVATRSKRPNGFRKMVGYADRQHVVLMSILEWIGQASHIDQDVRSCFCEGDAEKILSIARYWIGTDGNTLPRLEGWQLTHELPYPYGISENIYGELFKTLGHNESGIQKYFSARASRLSSKPVIAYDSTTISTYSRNQVEARQGFNKAHDGLNTIKLLTLYSVKDEEPIAYAKQPGNIPDVIALENAAEQLKCFDIEKPLITTDTGYYSESNLRDLCRRNMKFLTLIDTDVSMARDVVDTLKNELSTMGAVCPFDYAVSGAKTTIMHEFHFQRQRTRGGIAAGETESFTRRLYFYVFKSNDLWEKHEAVFREKLMELKNQLESGVTEFTEVAQKRIERYFIRSKVGRGGDMHISFNEEACTKAREYFGYFVLVSNTPLDVFEALENYRLRERIEELFQDEKNSVDGRRPRLWNSDALRGRMFVQFVALCYRCFIMKKIRLIKETLCSDIENKSQKQINLEKSLKTWLEQRSLAQILDWFDCLETTTVRTEFGIKRWTTESVSRDRLFMEMLGIKA